MNNNHKANAGAYIVMSLITLIALIHLSDTLPDWLSIPIAVVAYLLTLIIMVSLSCIHFSLVNFRNLLYRGQVYLDEILALSMLEDTAITEEIMNAHRSALAEASESLQDVVDNSGDISYVISHTSILTGSLALFVANLTLAHLDVGVWWHMYSSTFLVFYFVGRYYLKFSMSKALTDAKLFIEKEGELNELR